MYARFVKNQNGRPSCLSVATCLAVENARHGSPIELSWTFLHYNARRFATASPSVVDVFAAAGRHGLAPEQFWPAGSSGEPSRALYQLAAKCMLDTPLPCHGVASMRLCLERGYAGVMLYDTKLLNQLGYAVRSVNRKHASAVIGDDGSAFIVCNTWGPQWGDKGQFKLPYEMVTKGGLVKACYGVRLRVPLLSRPLHVQNVLGR